MKKRLFLLVLLVSGMVNLKIKAALPPQESQEPLLPSFQLPPDMQKHLLSYVVADLKTKPYFIEAIKSAEPLAKISHQFRDIVLDALASRFKSAGEAQNEFFKLMYRGELCPLALEALKKAEASLNKENPDGLTPLVFALKRGLIGMALMLIDKGADVNKPAPFDGTYPIEGAAILYEISAKNAKVITAMINAGADLKVKNIGKRLLTKAIDYKDESMVKLLKNKSAQE